jgi:hypothetical protein
MLKIWSAELGRLFSLGSEKSDINGINIDMEAISRIAAPIDIINTKTPCLFLDRDKYGRILVGDVRNFIVYSNG